MPQAALPSDWQDRFSDPYAVLGIPLTADDRRITKRLRTISKGLHPDLQTNPDTKDFATLVLAKVVNPAYERLKQEKSRNEVKALLRARVRTLNRPAPWKPTTAIASELLQYPASGVEIFYEQAISNLADAQYQAFSVAEFETTTQQILELNLIYLQLTMGEGFLRSERPTGMVPAATAQPPQFTPTPPSVVRQESYDRRHYRRANQYMKRGEWPLAVEELREAIKLKADEADYHGLLGAAYYHQNLLSMARVYIRQALKLKPDHPLSRKYATRLGMDSAAGAAPGTGKAVAADRPQGHPQARPNNGATPPNGNPANPVDKPNRNAPISYVRASQKSPGWWGRLRSFLFG
jgi:curved DNA-binding protein CbpA